MTGTDAFDLTGKVAVVTGAGGGIGESCAKVLAAAGATVVCADLDAAGAERVAAEIVADGGKAAGRRVDVTSALEVTALVAEAVAYHGQLDIMVNNAGILILTPILDISPGEFQKVLEVNLHGVMYGCQAAARVMRPGSSIINMSSGIIDRPSPGRASYAASKGAVHQLTRAFALELGPAGIRVNGVAPGWVITGITQQSYVNDDGAVDEAAFVARVADRAAGSPLNSIVEPHDVGLAVLYLASDAGRAYTGQVLRTNGGTVMV
ncbi:MAG: SDR family NAD(P)-dependent oxidoreductase [Ilumatobacteraceae bacterium]